MRLLHTFTAGFIGLLLLSSPVWADDAPPSPLRLIPAEADLLLHIPAPAKVLEAANRLDILNQFATLPAVKEQLEGTANRRLRQLLAHFEKKLDAKYGDLLDRLAGGGMALGLKFAAKDAPVVLVVQGTDEKLVTRFLDEAIQIIESELARQESKEQVKKGDYKGVPGYRIGNFFLARVGSTLIAATRKEAMQKVLDLHASKEGKTMADHPGVREARKLLPANALAMGWVNMKPVQESPQGKDLYTSPRDNSLLTILFGGYIDVLGRTPYFSGALTEEKGTVTLSFRAPAGREGMGNDRYLYLPPEKGPASKPLLEPKGVLYSNSFYLDMANFWKERDKIFTKPQAENFEKADKQAGPFIGGVKLSRLFESAGSYHRFVAANQSKIPYQKQPQTKLPAFAFVTEMRDSNRFGRSMDTILRFAALAATQQFKMLLTEEKYKEVNIAGYRFDEKAVVKDDVTDFRFNFSPCFAQVGNEFIFCSTIELCRDIIDALQAEAKSTTPSKKAKADRFYASGLADLLRDQEDTLITQTILDQAVPPAEAKKQVDALIKLVRGIGGIRTSVEFAPKSFRYDIRVQLSK